MKIHLFTQCMVDMFYPQVGIAAVEVLERLGCDITVPKKQVCCGQPLINSGYVKASKASIKNTIEAFEDAETIVSLSGSCAFAMKHEYMKILADEPQWAIRAQRVADRLYEFTDFIVNVLGVTDVGATLNKKVTFHKSCHATRLLGVKEPPLILLQNVHGLEYVEMERLTVAAVSAEPSPSNSLTFLSRSLLKKRRLSSTAAPTFSAVQTRPA